MTLPDEPFPSAVLDGGRLPKAPHNLLALLRPLARRQRRYAALQTACAEATRAGRREDADRLAQETATFGRALLFDLHQLGDVWHFATAVIEANYGAA